MEHISKIIKEWLSGWNECSKCHHMCNVGNIVYLKDKGHLCLDCLSNDS